ncbi:MAG: TonB-dependent receptor, partial [Bacteroidales bacterium]|nr:TonB-dependent receptor [Bacteroidales bacterium]
NIFEHNAGTYTYTFDGKWLERAKISKLRVYLSGENLFTLSPIYKHTSMFDPEVINNGDSDFTSGTNTSMGDGYSYPMLRTYTIGVNLTF